MAKQKENNSDTQTVTIKVEWLVGSVLAILLVVSIVTSGFSNLPFNLKSPFNSSVLGEDVLTADEVKERTLKYINEELLQGSSVAEITEITEDEDSSLYKIKLLIQGQEYDSYVSKDGKFLYTERMEMILGEEKVVEMPKSDKPEVLLFTMSYCPFGNDAEVFVEPVQQLLGDKVDIQPHYIVSKDGDNWDSLHGVQELNQGVRELCVFKHQKDKFWAFVMDANVSCDYENVDTCWEGVAEKVGLDIGQIKSCEADEKDSLLAEELALSTQHSVSGSPTIIINGQLYEGSRTPEDFKKAVCSAFNNEPGECSQTLDSETGEASGSCN